MNNNKKKNLIYIKLPFHRYVKKVIKSDSNNV